MTPASLVCLFVQSVDNLTLCFDQLGRQLGRLLEVVPDVLDKVLLDNTQGNVLHTARDRMCAFSNRARRS